MTTQGRTSFFNRPPRIQSPFPSGEVEIHAPPAPLGPPPKPNWLLLALPFLGILVSAGAYLLISTSNNQSLVFVLPMLGVSVISAIGSIVAQAEQRKQHKQKAEDQEKQYAAILVQKRVELAELQARQQTIRSNVDPNLHTLLSRAKERNPKLWERRPVHEDFLSLRIGVGALPSTVKIVAPRADLVTTQLKEAIDLANEFGIVPNVPVTISLKNVGPLALVGSPETRTRIAMSLVCNLVTHHAPDEVNLYLVCSPEQASQWSWFKWLPHVNALSSKGRHIAFDRSNVKKVMDLLLDELHARQIKISADGKETGIADWPWLVLLAEDLESVRGEPAFGLILTQGQRLHATAISLVDQLGAVPSGCGAVAEVLPNEELKCTFAGPQAKSLTCQPDFADVALCEELARTLAPLQAQQMQRVDDLPTNVPLFNLLGIKSLEDFDAVQRWIHKAPAQLLPVPLGIMRGGKPLPLDLSPTGHGPHGLVAGTTGSGKSVLLRSLVIALAATHHPHEVGFILIDFKGGTAFATLDRLPHTLGMVTDLRGSLVDRAMTALKSELKRREEILVRAGVNDVGLYQRNIWAQGKGEPLPRLLVIIDEFAEFASNYPDLMGELISVAQRGRALGVHLILATQRPAGVVNANIWSNAKFRICLRVETREDSHEMLHRAEAADLGRDRPGRGFLQVGNNEVFELFQSAHAEGHYRIEGKTHALQQEIEIFEILPTGARKTLSEPAQAQELPTLTRSEAEVFVERLAQAAAKLRLEKLPSPWPEPLHEWYALPEIVGQLQWRGWNGATWESDSRTEHQVRAVLGMLDEPAKQRQVPLIINLAEEDGHLIVVGAPGAGKEMLLRTLIASLACNYTPADVNFFLVEFGGQALRMFQALPHTVGLFLPAEEERLQRLLRRLVKELEARKQICTEAGVESLVKVRALRSDQMPPALVVIITGFAQFWQMYQDQIDLLGHLIREGGANGIHLVIAAERPNEIPLKISGGVFRHLVFRLADAMDYDVELGRYPQSAKEKVPVGRGWFGRPAFEFQAAAPVDARDDSAQTPQLKDIANTMNMAWKGVRPEPVELLRDRIPFKEVLATYSARLGAEAGARPRLVIPIGLDDLRLQPAMVDLNRDGPNFVIAGPSQSGKTTTLITWALSLAELNAPRDVQFLLIGFRRGSLRVLAGLPHVLAHCENSVQFRETVEQLEREIKRRQQSGESSPAIVILIDDYDELVNTAGDDVSLASRLEEVVRKGRNVGLYWVIAGPTELATMYDRLGLIKQVKTGKSGILLRVSDPRESNVLGVWLAAKTGLTGIPPGRGFLVLNGREQLIQVASPEVGKGGRKDIQGWIAEISARSSGSGTSRAVWRAG